MRLSLGALIAMPIVGYFLFGELARFASPGPSGRLAEGIALAELTCQLRVPFGQAASIGLVGLFLLRMWRTAAVCLLVVAMSLYPLWKLRPSVQGVTKPPGVTLRVVAGNVLASNKNYDAVFDAISAEGPDVIALTEVTAAWRSAALARFGPAFPFVADGSDEGAWKGGACGQLLLSRVPVHSSKALEVHCDGIELRPVVEAVLDWNGTPLTVQVIHPVRPTRARRLRARMAIFARVAAAGPAPEMIGERVLIGDFNTTSSSPLFGRLERDTGLRDSRVGFGLLPTYTPYDPRISDRLPFGWRPSVPIDHALVSPGLEVTARGTILLPGSDHRGVTMTIRRPSGAAEPQGL